MEINNIQVLQADYENKDHVRDILNLMDRYARDPMGMEEELPGGVRAELVDRLREMPEAMTFLAYWGGQAAGIANCFVGFETFRARKVVNIHDLFVVADRRGKGIGQTLLHNIQKKARQLKCCKLTLEVRDDNPAFRLYEQFGFEEDDPPVWFLTKELY